MPRKRVAVFVAVLVFRLALSACSGGEAERGGAPEEQAGAAAYLDIEQAAFLRKRAEEGDAAMQCLYGMALLNGSAGRTDRAEGEEWLRKSAEAGDPRGEFEYGRLLFLGLGRERAQEASLPYLRAAAKRGSRDAAYFLGTALLVGDNVPMEPVEGRKWLEAAAEAGLVDAQSDMGIALYSGIGGVERNFTEAMRWFRLAARQGHGDSANKLGVMYRHGNGVEPDPEQAILWFTFGAALGDMYAQFNLANSYMNGEWVARDYLQAARWYEQSARRGSADSQYYLGCLYAEGIGVEKDLGRAREWLSQAHRNGYVKAEELLERLFEPDGGPPPDAAREPVQVGAAQLIRDSAGMSFPGIDAGRVVFLAIGPVVEITPGPDGRSVFLTVPGYPGVIYCDMGRDGDKQPDPERLRPGTVIRCVGAGTAGLPGFIRFVECRVEEGEERD